MDKRTMFALAATAFMVMSACSILLESDNDDSSAETEIVTYHFYLQLNDGTNTVDQWVLDQDAESQTSSSYNTALKAALDAAGMTYVISDSNWVTSITSNGITYSSTGTWKADGYRGFSIYYANGNNWKATSNYSEGTTFAIVLDKYAFTEPSDISKYDTSNASYGYWALLPTESTTGYDDVTYHFYLQLNNGTNSVKKWISSNAGEQNSTWWAFALKNALLDNGMSYVMSGNWIQSITANDIVYKSTGTWKSAGYYGYALYYANEKTWEPVSKYNESTTYSIVFDEYAFSQPTDISKYDTSTASYGYWALLPTASTTGYQSNSNNDNTMLYVGVAVGIIAIIVVAGVIYHIKKK
jgi:hypothetical protein